MDAVRCHAYLAPTYADGATPWLAYGNELARACGAEAVSVVDTMDGEDATFDRKGETERLLFAQFPANDAGWEELVRVAAREEMELLLSRGVHSLDGGKIVVASGGGTHALKAIELAGRMGAASGLPVRVLRVVRPLVNLSVGSSAWGLYLEEIRSTMELQCKLQGVKATVELLIGDSVPGMIAGSLAPDDFLLLGGPVNWRLLEHAEGAIPHEVLHAVSNPALLLVPAPTKTIRLSDVYWEDTIRLNLSPRDQWEAISLLVEALVEERQIPAPLARPISEAAWERERIQPTAVGSGVAIPHAALPEFPSIVGCLGVFPGGVRFSGEDPAFVQFAFLLITPRHDYGQYLDVLSQVARLMHKESNRTALLASKTPKSAAALLALHPLNAFPVRGNRMFTQ